MPFDLNNSDRTFVVNGDTLKFNHSRDDTVHIIAPTSNSLNFENDVKFANSISTDTIKNKSGDELLTYDNTNDKLFVKSNIDFANSTVSNLTNLTLNSSQILSSNLAGQSGDTSIDAEIDNMTISIGQNTNRTSGLTANRIMRSNGAGNLQVATFDTADVLRKNDTTDQAITSNLNFASGKKILYNGNQVALSDISGYTALQNEVDTNSNKTGITTQQANDIITNNSKVSITTQQANDIITNNSKVSITSQQASAIITNTDKVALTSGEYSKIQALPSVADINALAHTNDTGGTFFDQGVGVADINGNSVVLETSSLSGSRAYLSINSTDDDAKIIFDQDVDNGGFIVSNNSGNLGLNTNINLSSGKSYKINGSDLNFSDLGGTVANSQIASGITGSKISGEIPTTSVPSGLNTSLITAGQFDSLRIPSLPASKIGSGAFVDARIPNLATSKITSGTFVDARIPNLNASKITSGVISNSQLPTDIVRNNVDNQSIACNNFKISSGTANNDCVLTLEADTDDNNEASNPKLLFSQDNGATNASIAMTSGNDFTQYVSEGDFIFNTGRSTDKQIFKHNNTTCCEIKNTGISIATGKTYQVNGSQITSSNLSDGSTLVKNNTDIIIPDDKNIYRAYTDTGALGSALSNKWITIAVCPNLEATSGRSGRYANTTISMNDIGRNVFCKFTLSVIHANFTINIDNGGLMWDDNTGLEQVRLVGTSNTGYNASNGALFQIKATHANARFEIYEHASNLISNGFSLVTPVTDLDSNDARTRTTFTQISTGNTLTVANVSTFGVRDSINIEDFGKDFTLDFPSQSLFDADYLYRCGQIAYFKKRVVLESASEDIFQTHAKVSANNSNGLFYRTDALETNTIKNNVDGQEIACNTFTLNGGNSGDTTLTIRSDNDNVGGESDHPAIVLRQDGGAVQGKIDFRDGGNILTVQNTYAGLDFKTGRSSSSNPYQDFRFIQGDKTIATIKTTGLDLTTGNSGDCVLNITSNTDDNNDGDTPKIIFGKGSDLQRWGQIKILEGSDGDFEISGSQDITFRTNASTRKFNFNNVASGGNIVEISEDGLLLPLSGDDIYSGSVVSNQGLFSRMSAIDSSPTWVAITPASGYSTGTTSSSLGRLEYALVGKQVFIRGHIYKSSGTFGNNDLLFTIPSGVRPKYGTYEKLCPHPSPIYIFIKGTYYGSDVGEVSIHAPTGNLSTNSFYTFTTLNFSYLID
jgi:hypothetical protein